MEATRSPKRRFLQDPRGPTSQKMTFFKCLEVVNALQAVVLPLRMKNQTQNLQTRNTLQIFWEVAGLDRSPASWVQLRSYFKEKVVAPVQKTVNTTVGIRCADYMTPLYQQKLALISPTSGGRSVGKSSLADWDHGVCVCVTEEPRACVNSFEKNDSIKNPMTYLMCNKFPITGYLKWCHSRHVDINRHSCTVSDRQQHLSHRSI
jgi:hypothetical protein